MVFFLIPKNWCQMIVTSNKTNLLSEKSKLMIGKTWLPKQVPYLNKRENYLLGNGIVCASGIGDGKWDFIAGPDYTCPNFISQEKISITINKVEHQITSDIYRARETGLYYGISTIGDLKITIIDYTNPGISIISRLVVVENKSKVKNYSVQLNAYLKPKVGSGRNDIILKDSKGTNAAVSIHLDTSLHCFRGDQSKWVKNWDDRYLVTTWSDLQSSVQKNGNEYQVSSTVKNISGSKSKSFNLCHYAHYRDKSDDECVRIIRSRNGINDVEQSIVQWQDWFRNVPSKYSLEKIKDQRARDIVEGGMCVIKTNQTHEGGMVANEINYNLSWTRDAYCGLRGLLACGHTEESKHFIHYMNEIYRAYGFIPNAVSCGRNVFALYNGNHENNPNRYLGQLSPCPESNTAPETTALLILVARDYYRATNDLKTLIDADESLKYSMDIQLKEAIKNNYKLEFSGDETELCGAVSTLSAGYDRDLSKYWSMTSIALCNASLEFYIEYLSRKNENPSSYLNSIDGMVVDLNSELQKLKDALENDFWRTDVDKHSEGFYDWCRLKSDNSFPKGRIVNFSLFPIYYKVKLKYPERVEKNISAMKVHFNNLGKFIPLVPKIGDERYLGHNLGYLLWSLIEINDVQKKNVYDALVYGNSVQCWGSYNEAYDTDGKPNTNNLRTFETGVNIDAIAKYWNLGFQ